MQSMRAGVFMSQWSWVFLLRAIFDGRRVGACTLLAGSFLAPASTVGWAQSIPPPGTPVVAAGVSLPVLALCGAHTAKNLGPGCGSLVATEENVVAEIFRKESKKLRAAQTKSQPGQRTRCAG